MLTIPPWETWEDPECAARTRVRWKLNFFGERTSTGIMSMGLAEIAPEGILPMHQHDPSEIYYILDGKGYIEIEGTHHQLYSGQSIFIPSQAWHQTINGSSVPLRFIFTFPTDSFDQVAYNFAE